MKKLPYLFAAAALVMGVACGQAEKKTEESAEETSNTEEAVAEEETEMETDSIHFGEMITEEGAVSVDDFAMKMEGQDTLEVKIMATATDVCQKKGCWMKVKTADGGDMRIRFKDYGFFVPKDITGKNVVFEGIAFRDTVSVEDLRHYAEDGGKSPEEIAAITEPEINTSFLAHGVMIKN